MWKDFFAAGGWGMYPVSLFGFLLVVVSALHALRPDDRRERLARALARVTLAAGWLGTAMGIATSAHFLEKLQNKADQLQIFALGIEESLHNLVLALILQIIAGLLVAVGTLRAPAPARAE